jgi:hypothetical protein
MEAHGKTEGSSTAHLPTALAIQLCRFSKYAVIRYTIAEDFLVAVDLEFGGQYVLICRTEPISRKGYLCRSRWAPSLFPVISELLYKVTSLCRDGLCVRTNQFSAAGSQHHELKSGGPSAPRRRAFLRGLRLQRVNQQAGWTWI